MKSINNQSFHELEESIGYSFKDKTLLQNAMTHSSYVNEHKNAKDNERLEFLGDSILGLVVSNYIFSYKNNLKEGELTKIRSIVVCEKSLLQVAKSLNIGKYLRLGKGEKTSGGAKRSSILADATEALIAAIYLDSNLDTVSKYVLLWLEKTLISALNSKKNDDYKSKLQEEIQKVKGMILKYEISNVEGPDHDKIFTVSVFCNNKIIGTGIGSSKKLAEQMSAKNALENIDNFMN